MKRHILAAATLTMALSPLSVSAQTPGYPGSAEARGFRWYLAPTAQVTQINGETAAVTGLEFGWMVTPRFTLGLSSYRLANGIEANQADALGATDVEFFYSGITAAYALCDCPNYRISAQALIGGAEAHWREDYWGGMPDPDHRDENHRTSFVAEPGVGLDLGLASWIRLNLSGGYRFVTGGKSHSLSQDDMEGFTGTIGFRMGRF